MNPGESILFLKAALISYLFGSIPFGYLLIRIFKGEDIRATGSGNIGATNVARSGAKGLAIATLALDALKGAVPVWLYKNTFASSTSAAPGSSQYLFLLALPCWAALWAVLGHLFPAWLKFKGGKGVATALGVFAVLAPKPILLSLGVFILVVAVTRFVSLGSILATAALPFLAYFFQAELRTWPAMSMVCGIALLIIVKHHGNITRLMHGTEPRFGSKSAQSDDDAADGDQ